MRIHIGNINMAESDKNEKIKGNLRSNLLSFENQIMRKENENVDKNDDQNTLWVGNMIRKDGLIMIAGNSGSGKTTFFKQLLKNLDSPEKAMEDYFKS